jgi:hypothetical protein
MLKMQYTADRAVGPRTGGSVGQLSSWNETEDMLRRDLKFAQEQKVQADKLIETLSRRCEGLRETLLKERKESSERLASMEERNRQENIEKDKLLSTIRDLNQQVIHMNQQLQQERDKSIEYKNIAEAALQEAAEAVNQLMRFHGTSS